MLGLAATAIHLRFGSFAEPELCKYMLLALLVPVPESRPRRNAVDSCPAATEQHHMLAAKEVLQASRQATNSLIERRSTLSSLLTPTFCSGISSC